MFVAELGRELHGRLLDIWRGRDGDGNPVLTPEKCEAYRRVWRGARAEAPGKTSTRCAHLGEPTGETVGCRSCRGRVELKVFACGVYGACTLGKPHADVKGCCKGCASYEPVGNA